MPTMGIHWYDAWFGCIFLLVVITPWVVGFAWVLPDANRRRQPGLLWALLTLPLGWLAVLGYLIARSVQRP